MKACRAVRTFCNSDFRAHCLLSDLVGEVHNLADAALDDQLGTLVAREQGHVDLPVGSSWGEGGGVEGEGGEKKVIGHWVTKKRRFRRAFMATFVSKLARQR